MRAIIRLEPRTMFGYFALALAALGGLGACGNSGSVLAQASRDEDKNGTAANLHKPFGYRQAPAARPRIGNALPLGKCINMGGMLEYSVEARDNPRKIEDGDFATIRAAGFDTVRLPVKFSAHAGATPPYAIDPVLMRRVRHIVDAAVAQKLNIIIDVHHYTEVMHDPDAERDRYVAIWRQIAQAYQRDGKHVWFELLNEPSDKFWNRRSLTFIFSPAIAEIRKSNPTRPIVVAGNYGGDLRSLATLVIPADDPNLFPTFHFYEPKAFSHQGANWTHDVYPIGRALQQGDRAVIDDAVAQVQDYMERTGRVPFLGEYGAIEIKGVSPAERMTYYGWVSAAFASIGVQSCAWSYTNGFSLYDGRKWLPGALDAVQTTTTLLPPEQ